MAGVGSSAAAEETPPAARGLAETATIGIMALWAANFIIVKAATTVIPPIGFAFLRFSLAAVVLLVLLRVLEGGVRLPRREFARVAALGLVGFAIYQMLWTPALASIPAGDSALLIAATPVMTVLLAAAIGTDRLTRRKLGGAVISFAGVGIVVASGTGLALGASLVGDGLTLAAAACWAIYASFGASLLRRLSPLQTTAWAVTAGAIGLAPIGLLQLAGLDWQLVDAGAWAAVAYSGILPAGLTNVVIFSAIRVVGPARVTAYQFLVPAFAVAMGFAFLGEAIRLGQVVGGLVIVGGIALARRDGHRSGTASRLPRLGRAPRAAE